MTSMNEKVEKGIQFGISLIGTPYDWWRCGENQRDAPMFAKNGPCPPNNEIKTCNCVGLTNLMLRSVGNTLPYSDIDIGWTESYAIYYKKKNVIKDFNVDITYPRGSLLIRDYKDIYNPGHLAVILESIGKKSKILHSITSQQMNDNVKYYLPGVNNNDTIEQSHKFFQYEYVVLPNKWLGIN